MVRILIVAVLAAVPAWAQEPLPVSRSTRLSGKSYTIQGRVTLGKGIKLLCQRGVEIVGVDKGATLVVEGDFEAHGLRGQEVVLRDIHVELAPDFERARLAFAIFRGAAGLRTAKDHPAPTLYLCNMCDDSEISNTRNWKSSRISAEKRTNSPR